LFEKVRGPDARFQDIITILYNEFKINQGYTPDDIWAKSISLKGVLEPFSSQGNIDMLKRAGFLDINTIQKFLCFEGFLAIK
jgi:tRNA (cmo5U34)-methyltransferase